MSHKQWIERRRVGRGFQYSDETGVITKKPQLKYFRALRIPPAWREVKIAKNKRSRILATGYDAKGRLQYIYHPSFRASQDKIKFERILRFARALPHMREVTAVHLKRRNLDFEKVMACIVRLMDEAYFRVGNESYAKENQTYGLTTMRSKHTTVTGDTITFDFVGKSGKKHLKKITNRSLARIIKRLDELPGYEIFKYYDDKGMLRDVHSEDVNTYIKEIMGDEFSAKDFRTWGGTLLASAELAQAERAESERERKKVVTACVKKVALKLGNTPAVARSSYIDPRVIMAFVDSDDLSRVRQTVENMEASHLLSADEYCVLHLLEKAAV